MMLTKFFEKLTVNEEKSMYVFVNFAIILRYNIYHAHSEESNS